MRYHPRYRAGEMEQHVARSHGSPSGDQSSHQHRDAQGLKPTVDGLRQPMQPIGWSDGVIRFKPNPIVALLLEDATERGRLSIASIRVWVAEGRASADDMVQFVQLLGYSVSAMGDLDYVPHHTLVEIDREADKVWLDRNGE